MKRIYVLPSYGSEESIKSSSWSDKTFKRYLKFSICLLVCIFLLAMNAPILFTLVTKFSGFYRDKISVPPFNHTRENNETHASLQAQEEQEKALKEENDAKENARKEMDALREVQEKHLKEESDKALQEQLALYEAQQKNLTKIHEKNLKKVHINSKDCGSNCTSEKVITPIKPKLVANVSTEQAKPMEKINKPIEKAKKLMEKLSKLKGSSTTTIQPKTVMQAHPTTVVYSKDVIDSNVADSNVAYSNVADSNVAESPKVVDSIIGFHEEPVKIEEPVKTEEPAKIEEPVKPVRPVKIEDTIREKAHKLPTEKVYNLPTD